MILALLLAFNMNYQNEHFMIEYKMLITISRKRMETSNEFANMVDRSAKPIKLFYCYAHKDEKLKNELEKHLVSLKRQGQIVEWSDRRIEPGTDWKQSIDIHLSMADIILLLISPDFLNSDYCYSIGMQQAMERHEAGEVCVIPIIVRPVEWEGMPFSKLQVLPEAGKPVTLWENRDSAFCSIARGIRYTIETRRFQEKSNLEWGKSIRHTFSTSNTIHTEINNIIDTKEAVRLFYGLLRSHNKKRIFRIIGEANMGKSHLLNHVFRPLACDTFQMHCIMLDLRNPAHTIIDILCMIRNQIDSRILDEDNWRTLFLSNEWPRNPSLFVSHVVKELKKLDKPVLFLIDSIESAKKTVSAWLSEILLPALVFSLIQVRIVMAGRLLPKVPGTYVDLCHPQPPSPPYRLGPVEDEAEYINYCKHINATITEQSIRDFAYAFDYTPGTFATLIHAKFLP
jgi:TIR domain